MKKKKGLSLPIQILIGLLVGIVVGIFLQSKPEIASTYIKPLGTLFLNLIKLVIVPLVFASLVVGVADLKDAKEIGKIGMKTFVYFFLTTAFAIVIGLILANLLDVSSGFTLPADQLQFEAKEAPSFIDTLINIVPSNPLKSLVEGQMLQIIVFALILGGGLLYAGEKEQQYLISSTAYKKQ